MKVKQYFIWFKEEDSLILKITEDANRPNNASCEEVLQNWISDNYGVNAQYEYYELDTLEMVEIV